MKNNPSSTRVWNSWLALLPTLGILLSQSADASETLYRFQQGVWNGTVEDVNYTMEDAGVSGMVLKEPPIDHTTTNFNGEETNTLRSTRPGSAGGAGRGIVYRFDISALPEGAVTSANFHFTPLNPLPNIYEWTLYALPAENIVWTDATATMKFQDGIEGETPWLSRYGTAEPHLRAAALTGDILGVVHQELHEPTTVTISLDPRMVEQWLNKGLAMMYLEMANLRGDTGSDTSIVSSGGPHAELRPLLEITVNEESLAP